MASAKMTPQLRNQIAANNSAETASRAHGLQNEFSKQLNAKAFASDTLSQLLGMGGSETPKSDSKSHSADMTPGQEFTLPKKAAPVETHHEEKKVHIEAGNNYHGEIAHSSERSNRQESQELKMQIQEIMNELKRLVDSSDKVMQMAYADITVASAPAKVGKYHTNFFAFLLIVIQQARQKVEDSGAWMSVSKSKGGKRSYNVQAKKGGTSFTQSMDRSAATSTG